MPSLQCEPLLRRQRAAAIVALIIVAGASWAWLLPAALDMQGDMRGLAAWMMAPAWDARYAALIFLMWSLMMVAMMLPSAAPGILLFGRAVVTSPAPQRPVLRVYAFAAGYAATWLAFSAAATALQWMLARVGLLDPMMRAPRTVGGLLLIVAGAYQLSALKHACLRRCRSPLEFLLQRWRPGVSGAFAMGVAHGVQCVGCCWALMLLLFAGGVMNLAWIGGIAVFVLLEKLAPQGVQSGRFIGVVLLLAGLGIVASTLPR